MEHAAEGEDVGARVDVTGERLLRRHVDQRSLRGPGLGLLRLVLRKGDPEVGELHVSRPRHEDVARAHVAVDDPERLPEWVHGFVGGGQCMADLRDDVERHVERQAAPVREAQERSSVDPVDELEDLERRAVDDPVVEHRDDVGVVQAARDARFVEEHARERRILECSAQHPLDGHAADEPSLAGRLRLQHLGHAAAPEPPYDSVSARRHDCRLPSDP